MAPADGQSLLCVDDVHEAAAHVGLGQGREAGARAARLQRGDDLADVVADQAEARVPRVLLDHWHARAADLCRQHWHATAAELFIWHVVVSSYSTKDSFSMGACSTAPGRSNYFD